MNFQVARYVRVQFPGQWRGWAFVGTNRPIAGSRAAAMQLTRDDWNKAWQFISAQGAATDRRNVLKTSPDKTVLRLDLVLPGGTLEVICKRTHPRGLLARLISRLRTPKEWTSFERGNRLIDAGLRTPLPLAVLRRRSGILGRQVLLVTEAVTGAVDLDRAATVELARLGGAELHRTKRRLAQSIVELLAGLQQLRLYHRDMKATNVLIAGLAKQGAPVRAVLVDLDALRRQGRLSRKHIWQPVMRLNASLARHPVVTRTDRLRFLGGFLRAIGRPPAAAKGYWRILEVWSGRYLRRQRRRTKRKIRRHAAD